MLVLERFLYIGPNRRSERTAIEWLLEPEPGEIDALRVGLRGAWQSLAARLGAAGICLKADPSVGRTDAPGLPADWMGAAGAAIGELAVALQRAAGHDVRFVALLAGEDARRRLVFEYEHADTGIEAGEIAAWLLAESLPGLNWVSGEEVAGADADDALRQFLERAPAYALPRDTQAIIDAAVRLDVPCTKLEREPYRGVTGDFRIRRNGLLRLGHACRMRIVDGTLCLDRSAALVPLLFDRSRLTACMRELNLPIAARAPGPGPLVAARRVARAAASLGFPVVLKPVRRRAYGAAASGGPRPALRNEAQLLDELQRLRRDSPEVQVEAFVEGDTWQVLVGGGRALCAVSAGAEPVAIDAVHPALVELAGNVARRLDCGLLSMTFVTPDPQRPLADCGGKVVSLDPAPRLDRLLPPDSVWLPRAAEAFVRWLYPPGTAARIPLIAVTGTNGKTTTSRMLARIATQAGHVTGLACTSGVYVDGQLRSAGDHAGTGGHHLVFESREVDVGVLETARGGVTHSGFMFDRCDVAVCLNVTEDHIGELGIESLEHMIAVKRSILERAVRAVVLNADYETCLSMLPFPAGVAVWLCSLTRDARSLLAQAGPDGGACVLEPDPASGTVEPWLVCYAGDRRTPILPVAAIPAALGGAARFNVSNAQHAVAAAWAMGFDAEHIAGALRAFDTRFETNPGRLNVYRGHPFTVIMDYAHNPDGMAQLLDCLDRMECRGRRILLYAATGNRTDDEVRKHTVFPVGRVDHFVVRRYPGKLRGRRPDEIPSLMRAALLEAGVPSAQITVADPPERGAEIAMRLARPGDIVIVAPGSYEFDAMWQQVVGFEPQPGSAPELSSR